MNIKSISIRTALVASVLTIYSCGGGEPKESPDTAPTTDSTEVQAEVESEAPTYPLPSPLQIASIFKKSGLKYFEGLTNPTSNISKYSSNTSKSINLGVYSADMAYAALNKQNQATIDYLKASRQLADQMGMGSIFETNNLFKRFEKNVSNEDSLASIIAELQMETDMYLEDNEREHVSAIVFAGAWTESMYIGSKVYEKNKDAKITARIVEQMTILTNIIHVLKSYEAKDNTITSIVTDLSLIKDTYAGLESVKKAQANDSEDAPAIVLTEAEAMLVSKQIIEVRTKFING
ncbi:MAG: hypothetical protein J0M08_10520 [Bacteroidetes bacterium]|nr:hypothetical protein [Bacteroidota bacterium]